MSGLSARIDDRNRLSPPPGETWDYTATQHILLAELEIEGKARKVLMQAPKNGFFYVLDRATGELISAEPFVKITWATHVDKATGRPVETENAALGNPRLYGVSGGLFPACYHP